MDSSPKAPSLIPGGFAVDDRGQVSFVNGFAFNAVQRFYLVENFSTQVVRAFHGHLQEEKFVLVVAGSAIVAAVPIDDPIRPNRQIKPDRFVLSARQPQILHVPAGYANGFRPLEPGTKILFFSTATLEQAKSDDFRFPHDYWGPSVWEVEPR
ncbi:MAG: dTDP-4-dehydrorhamnose 3,5-epimerase family protein [Acidobacteriia bacterium]|nr:dTDP-4-dehydrorhamnose 3,5-epimerase family protein [Terriglobia bacterium]